MSELDRWMKILLDKDVSGEAIKEFAILYRDMVTSTVINDDFDAHDMFTVIDYFGDDNSESEMLRRYLYYLYGKFVAADIYAGVIGETAGEVDEDYREVLWNVMDEAISKITKK